MDSKSHTVLDSTNTMETTTHPSLGTPYHKKRQTSLSLTNPVVQFGATHPVCPAERNKKYKRPFIKVVINNNTRVRRTQLIAAVTWPRMLGVLWSLGAKNNKQEP